MMKLGESSPYGRFIDGVEKEPERMTVTVQLFARAADLAGGPQVELDLADGATVADLRAALVRAKPDLAPIASKLLVAIGQAYVRDHDRVRPDAEIACFPPVSGG